VSDSGTSVATVAEPRPVAREAVPGWIVGLMRIVVTLWAVLVFLQPVLAGQFLDGNDDLVAVHGTNAAFVLLIALVVLIGAVLLWRPGHGAAWPVGASALLLILGLCPVGSWRFRPAGRSCAAGGSALRIRGGDARVGVVAQDSHPPVAYLDVSGRALQ